MSDLWKNSTSKSERYEICDFMFRLVSNLSDLAPQFLPPANVVCEGYVFTGLCLSTGGGGGVLSQHALQVVSQHALQQVSRGGIIPAWLAGFQAHTQGGSLGGSGRGGGDTCSKGGGVPALGEEVWRPPRDGYCWGRYASYWIAFLLRVFWTQSNFWWLIEPTYWVCKNR